MVSASGFGPTNVTRPWDSETNGRTSASSQSRSREASAERRVMNERYSCGTNRRPALSPQIRISAPQSSNSSSVPNVVSASMRRHASATSASVASESRWLETPTVSPLNVATLTPALGRKVRRDPRLHVESQHVATVRAGHVRQPGFPWRCKVCGGPGREIDEGQRSIDLQSEGHGWCERAEQHRLGRDRRTLCASQGQRDQQLALRDAETCDPIARERQRGAGVFDQLVDEAKRNDDMTFADHALEPALGDQ